MTMVLDNGALIALERNERAMWVRLKAAQRAGTLPITYAGVVGQVWRGRPRHARLAHALHAIHVRSIDDDLGRAAGVLLATAGLDDVIDAAIVLLTNDGDEIVTSNRADIAQLAEAADRLIEIVHP